MKDERAQEEERLERVNQEIAAQLAEITGRTTDYRRRLQSVRRSLWEENRIAGGGSAGAKADMTQKLDELQRHGQEFGFSHGKMKQLNQLASSPYFARIDFRETAECDAEAFYIGAASLVERQSNQPLIYDWRAPISSMFYDFGLGPAGYDSPVGWIGGELVLKRQFRIVDGRLAYMFDSELAIEDDVLQEILGQNTDISLRQIITTIQREQNAVIRDDKHDVLIVKGVAGSGKSSIALHRAAYLLYRYRDSLAANDIVILSPNYLFSGYISNVLPILGEDNTVQMTWQTYAEQFLPGLQIESGHEHLEYLFSRQRDADYALQRSAAAFKLSSAFKQVLEAYLQYLEEEAFPVHDLVLAGETVLAAQEIQASLEGYSDLPLKKRLEKLRRRLRHFLHPVKRRLVKQAMDALSKEAEVGEWTRWELLRASVVKARRQWQAFEARLDQFRWLEPVAVYTRLLTEPGLAAALVPEVELPPDWEAIGRMTAADLAQGRVRYADTAPLLYLQGAIEGYPHRRRIRHVIIDEAQDYSVLQLALIRKLFPKSAFTILADPNQSIYPSCQNQNSIETAFAHKRRAIIELRRSYRATEQLTAFSQALLGQREGAESVARSGSRPVLSRCFSHQAQMDAMREDIRWLATERYTTIAVLCRTHQECSATAAALEKSTPLTLVQPTDTGLKEGLLVLPIYLAKGLEFDAVLVPYLDASTYVDSEDRALLYTACTRALHQLYLYYSETLSPLLHAVTPALYNDVYRQESDGGWRKDTR